MPMRSIVVPGSVVDEKGYSGDNTVKAERGIVSTRLGVSAFHGRKVSVIPHSGPYKPRKGDFVLGVVVGYKRNGWDVDLGTASKAFLPASEAGIGRRFDPRRDELNKILRIGDVISAKIIQASRLRYPLLTMKERNLHKITDGVFRKVTVAKIPRIIGKKGSMLKVLKDSGFIQEILVGQNGVIGIIRPKESYGKVEAALDLIVEKTYARGLTEGVAEILKT